MADKPLPVNQEEEARRLLRDCLAALNRSPRFNINVSGYRDSYQLAEAVEAFLKKSQDGRRVYRNPLLSVPYGEDQQ